MAEILKKLDQRMPKVTFRDLEATTSAKHSKAALLNRKDSYCVGDHLTVRLDAYDHLGRRKKYGGDFLRARIYSSHLKAGASGLIEDYRNGTYLVNFTLFWRGEVRVSILLIHPSEGVSALWAARKKGYGKIGFTGQFLNGTSDVFTKCGFNITTEEEQCEYLDERDQEAFYCVKPKHVPCEAFTHLKSHNKPVSYLTALEKSLLYRNNTGIEIPQTFGAIQVLSCNRSETWAREKCRTGMESTLPSGYVLQNAWHPDFCSLSDFSTTDQVHACLKKKMVYLMGDSTLRQWIYTLAEKVKTLKFFDGHGKGVFRTHLIMDPERNTLVQWKRHGHPFVTLQLYSVKDHEYVAHAIDRVDGGENTVVAITLGQHFRPFPIHLFVRRLLNVREAILRLHLRSPSTRVIIKGENIREMYIDPERLGDVNGYPQNLVTRDIFQGLNVGFIDGWDMSIAYGINHVHPASHIVWSQIIMFLTYIC
ncbi:NXPE family member 1-like [Heteronotia binoei]|uniref:NXPE family member 1-like n=1 Tax=Heteronotia binoei TaxID=13085 RepID=UPI00292CDBC6|nr:NXPE family member 1-like [Heteronotia binoei]